MPESLVLVPRIVRLTTQSIHRLRSLAWSDDQRYDWREETFTEVLLSHLAGMAYTVDAKCPRCMIDYSDTCTWSQDEEQDLEPAGVYLTSVARGAELKTGADFFIVFQHEDREIRLAIQAKKLWWDTGREQLGINSMNVEQLDTLIARARESSGVSYYLFYTNAPHAHHTFTQAHCSCTKRTHVTAEGTAALLVSAPKVRKAVTTHGTSGDRFVREVLSMSRPLTCLRDPDWPDDRDPDPAGHDFAAVERFLAEDAEDFTRPPGGHLVPCPRSAPWATDAKNRVVQRFTSDTATHRAKPTAGSPRRKNRARDEPGEVICVLLRDYTGHVRGDDSHGGWYPDDDPAQTMEAARRYWGCALGRAQTCSYLVALSSGTARGCWKIAQEPSRTITGPHSGLVEFELEDVQESEQFRAALKAAAERERTNFMNRQDFFYFTFTPPAPRET